MVRELPLAGVFNQQYIMGLHSPTEAQLPAVGRPVETENIAFVKMSELVRGGLSQPHAPNIVAILSPIDVGQFAAIGAPTDAGGQINRKRDVYDFAQFFAV